MSDNADKIEAIDQVLGAGAEKVTFDGTTVEYDFDHLRRQKRQLEANDDTRRGKRPVVARVDLSGF